MTRAIIADPDLPLKVADGRRPRPCIGLNDGCIGRLYTGMPMYCSVNPAIRNPGLAEVAPAEEPARVVVIGGGVAGLEAARAAALRGHEVVLFERRPSSAVVLGWLGCGPGANAGIVYRLAARGGRGGGRRDPAWESRRTPRPCSRRSPTPSSWRRDRSFGPRRDCPGRCRCSTSTSCWRAARILPDPSSGSALILDDDGHQLAPTAAEVLVAAGFEVEIATTHQSVGDLIDATQSPFVLQRLARDGVRLSPNVAGVSSSPGGAVTLRHLYSEQEEQREGVGLIVITGRRKGLTTLRDDLAASRAKPAGRRSSATPSRPGR